MRASRGRGSRSRTHFRPPSTNCWRTCLVRCIESAQTHLARVCSLLTRASDRTLRLVGTYPHDAQLDYFRLTHPKALHTDSIPEQLHSVSRFRINSVQCRSRSFDKAHHRTARVAAARLSRSVLAYKPRCSPTLFSMCHLFYAPIRNQPSRTLYPGKHEVPDSLERTCSYL